LGFVIIVAVGVPDGGLCGEITAGDFVGFIFLYLQRMIWHLIVPLLRRHHTLPAARLRLNALTLAWKQNRQRFD